MDVGNGVLQFERTILSASVKPVKPQQTSAADQYDIFIFEIRGLAFLYHQVHRDKSQAAAFLWDVFLLRLASFKCTVWLCAAGPLHDGAASPDRAETGSSGDNQSAPGCSE